jgi:hypothetical protein
MTVAMRVKQTNVQEAGWERVVAVIQMATLGALILPTFPTSSTWCCPKEVLLSNHNWLNYHNTYTLVFCDAPSNVLFV